MVGGATHQQQQQQPPSQLAPPSSSIAPAPTTEEEEFLKRNTDCVYFLASPLTCKKGSECEYRHSDIARVNPRDCWYWLNGNCLNPKCGFRHPPLDGLLGAEAPTPMVPSVPQAPVPPAYATPKQGVACIFFQKGFCLKGHLCPFLHGPPNKPTQSAPPNTTTKPPNMAHAGPEKSVQDQKFTHQETVQKPVEFHLPQRKQVPKLQTLAPARNGSGPSVAIDKKAARPASYEPPRYRPAPVAPPPVTNEFPANRYNHGVYETHHVSDNDGILNGKDPDEYSREPTPGFDVLVDNELGESEYYHNEEQFGKSSSHDFDIDRDIYNEHRDYERYAWDDHKSANLERKRYPRDESPDRFDQSDLRHRISKQRRGNNVSGLRSVVSREHPSDRHTDRVQPTRDTHHRHHHHRLDQGGSISSRLRGRIKIPGTSMSPGNENEHRSRYSPQALSSHSRLRDRIKGRVSDDYDYNNNNNNNNNNKSKFTGPKRLSELKRGYEDQKDEREFLGKRKYPRVETQQSEDNNLSFEGPKPLSEILKRKRGVESTVFDTRVSSVTNEDENSKETKEKRTDSTGFSLNLEDNQEKRTDLIGFSFNREDNNLKEAGQIDEDEMLDKELEAYDHRDGDYDYEQIDGEDYNLDEGENPDEEYIEEEGDQYGKKESDVYS